MASHPLTLRVRRALRAVADPAKAAGMQAYMKSTMPYHGVPSPILRKTVKDVFRDAAFPEAAPWQAAVRALWDEATHREERYAAIALAEDKRFKAHWQPDTLGLFEHMIVTGAWWDYVDVLASHHVGGLLRLFPGELTAAMRAWSTGDDMWKRRTSIICQLGFKDRTDRALLYACIAPSLDAKEFFLRKGIGWALRQLAWTDPAEVVRYVTAHKDRLSPLSKREALKNVLKQGLIDAIP